MRKGAQTRTLPLYLVATKIFPQASTGQGSLTGAARSLSFLVRIPLFDSDRSWGKSWNFGHQGMNSTSILQSVAPTSLPANANPSPSLENPSWQACQSGRRRILAKTSWLVESPPSPGFPRSHLTCPGVPGPQ